MAMLTPVSITNLDKTEANRYVVRLLDLDIYDQELELSKQTDVSQTEQRVLLALKDRRNMLARHFGIREREKWL
jgi:hypothetical protein